MTLRIAVVSDIHADQQTGRWTRVSAEPPAARSGQHPLADLADLVRTQPLSADYLVVPGDIANQANTDGLAYGWRKVHSLAAGLGALVVAAPGNHDVMTHDDVADPRGGLKGLLPTFPTGDSTADAQFWSQGWCLLEKPDHRILVLDSTLDFPSFPTGVRKNSPAWRRYLSAIDRGGLTERVEEDLARKLATLDDKLNIAVIHHHPVEHQLRTFLQDGYGPMRRGSELIDLFCRFPSAGRWLVIHGHKHVPQLVNATSTTSSGPVVLCAASLGAKLWDPIDTVARNQFHLITVRSDYSAAMPGLTGEVMSYTWGMGDGWQVSERRGSGLPAEAGFGSMEDYRTVAARVEAAMNTGPADFLHYADLKSLVPQLPFLLPTDWNYLEDYLETRGFGFTRDRLNRIVQLARVV
ncbi:metallophosphoesterase family protein [Marisediminicola sp. LYQ85]|uniref:metallophosphoesterase family protein n=1 Tax=Marisediminicola sp. LYQ85 TaxID=3391062 RepID=UPI003982F91D